jgi:hypothetical protein
VERREGLIGGTILEKKLKRFGIKTGARRRLICLKAVKVHFFQEPKNKTLYSKAGGPSNRDWLSTDFNFF